MKKLLVATTLLPLFVGCQNQVKFEAPLFANLGEYQLVISTESDDAQHFFTQGVIMANGFNHSEAARSFREAINLDPECAMAYWGLAYVLGPNYNTSNMSSEARMEVLTAIEKANSLSHQISPWEQAVLRTISVRFPVTHDVAQEEAYSEELADAFQRFPENDLIATLYAESLMNMHAWDLYSRIDKQERPWTPKIKSVLEQAIRANPQNPLANHLYIHAVEAGEPEKAYLSAQRLATLVPGLGHLVHMPSHIYINTGDYHLGSLANEQAVVVDSIYIAQCQAQGVYPQLYYPHNYHFLAATAALEGRGARSIEAAFKMSEIIDRNYLTKEGFETTQHYLTVPYNALVKFAQWEKILALPQPSRELEYPRAIWHYARGMAYANLEKPDKAALELARLEELSSAKSVQTMWIWEINTAADIVSIGSNVLSGEMARINGDIETALEHFEAAKAGEDQLNYNEPPDWFFSVRHLLGDLHLRRQDYLAAEKAYREDLFLFPQNGFALNGLYHSLVGEQRTVEAHEVLVQFERSWQYADSELEYSRINSATRQNLVLNVEEDSAQDLVRLVASFCGL